jgi:four helix bundle protein
MAQDYRELLVWQKAIDLTPLVYKLTQAFPKNEIYGLTSQMQRASISVASNIAEGRGRIGPGEFRQFLGIARGSTCELLTQLHIARKLGFADGTVLDEAESFGNEVSKMLLSFIHTLDKANARNVAESRHATRITASR